MRLISGLKFDKAILTFAKAGERSWECPRCSHQKKIITNRNTSSFPSNLGLWLSFGCLPCLHFICFRCQWCSAPQRQHPLNGFIFKGMHALYTNFHIRQHWISTPSEEVKNSFYPVNIGFVTTTICRIRVLSVGSTILYTKSATAWVFSWLRR